MAIVEELLRSETNGAISFGNHKLAQKTKKEAALGAGDLYKVKTFGEMTRLEKNDMFLYESVPGTSVLHFMETDQGVAFSVEGDEDAQLTIGLKEDTQYEVFVNGCSVGKMSTGLSGKLRLSVELEIVGEVLVKIIQE